MQKIASLSSLLQPDDTISLLWQTPQACPEVSMMSPPQRIWVSSVTDDVTTCHDTVWCHHGSKLHPYPFLSLFITFVKYIFFYCCSGLPHILACWQLQESLWFLSSHLLKKKSFRILAFCLQPLCFYLSSFWLSFQVLVVTIIFKIKLR